MIVNLLAYEVIQVVHQGAAGKIGLKGDKGDRGAPAVEIDSV